MRDLNFFSPYSKKKERSGGGLKLIAIALGVLLACAAVLYSALLMIDVRSMEKELEKLGETMADPKFTEGLKEAQEINAQVQEMSKEKEFFADLNGTMVRVHRVNEEFMKFLSSEVVKDLFLTDLTIDNRNITLTGRALTREAIAQFEYDLRQTKRFSAIKVNEISKKDATSKYQIFTMVIETVEEVTANEN